MADSNEIRAGKAYVEGRFDDAGIREGTRRAEAYLKSLGQAARDVDSKAGKGGFLENWASKAKEFRRERRASGESALQRSLSAGGLADMAAESLGIGLPVMIADQLGKGFASATEKAAKMREELRSGKITQEEMVRSMATGIPILGGWVQGFLNIRDMIDGDKEAIERMNEEMAINEKFMNASIRAAVTYREIIEKIVAGTDKINRHTVATFPGSDQATKAEEEYQNRKEELETRKTNNDNARKFVGMNYNAEADKYSADMQKRIDAAEEDLKRASAKRDAELNNYRVGGSVNAKAQEQWKNDPGYKNAKDRVEALRKEAVNGRKNILDLDDKQIAAEMRDNENNRLSALKQATIERTDIDTKTAQQLLQNRNKAYEADTLALKTELDKQLKLEDERTKSQLENSKAGPGTKRFEEIYAEGEKKKATWRNSASAKQEALDIKEFARKRKLQLDVDLAKNSAIEDQQKRDMENLESRYQTEMDIAKNANADTLHIEAQHEADLQAMKEQHRRQNEDRDRESVGKLADLQAAGILDRHRREMAELDARYKKEMEYAKAHPGERKQADVQAEWEQSKSNLKTQQQNEIADANRAVDLEIAKLKNGITSFGVGQRLNEIEIERKEDIRKEKDERTTTGVGLDKINQKYDLERARELMTSSYSVGSFGASRSLGNSGQPILTKLDQQLIVLNQIRLNTQSGGAYQ